MRVTKAYQEHVELLHFGRQLANSRSKVFVAVDIEWDETDRETILEIGLAILDTRQGRLHPNRFPPSTWSIRPRHIIISENIDIHNHRFVRSRKFGFKFGKSYVARMDKAMESILVQLSRYEPDELVFVGHGINTDLRILEATGHRIQTGALVLDTMRIERAYSRRVNGKFRNLGAICDELDIPYYAERKLHNAGNDAFFNMAIFAEMCCVEDRTDVQAVRKSDEDRRRRRRLEHDDTLVFAM
jgi:hypothetical protein